jgi:glycosyltransferase involved in cell wall biosynthesis
MNAGVSRFVAVSERLRDAIHKEGLLNPTKTSVIYNGIDCSRYGRRATTELRRSIGLSDDAILIGSLGNLHPAKAYDDLIRATRLVVDVNPAAHFVIAGDIKPHLIGGLEQLKIELGVVDNVHFIGFVDDSAAFLGQIDMFLLTSTSEGFSIATVEAMATGLPCVVTRCGGPEEIVTDGVDALMVEPAQPVLIARVVLELLERKDMRASLASAANASSQARFGLDAMIGAYNRLYDCYAAS